MKSIDTETTGLDLRHSARPFFVGIADENNLEEPSYWEWDVDPLTRMPIIPEEDLEQIRMELVFGEELVFHNAKFDVRALEVIDCVKNWPWERTHETLFTSHLLASNQPKDLTTCALIYLKTSIKRYEDRLAEAVKECRAFVKKKYPKWQIAHKDGLPGFPSMKGSDGIWKNDMWLPRAVATAENLPENHYYWTVLRDYSLADSTVTLPLFRRHEELIETKGLQNIYRELRKLLKIVYGMESRGVTINKERMYELRDQYTLTAEKCNRVCINLSGGKLTTLPKSVNNELRSVVFDELKLTTERKTDTGAASLDKSVIEDWLNTLPTNSRQYTFIKNMAAFRKRSTALGFQQSYEKYWVPLGIFNEKGEQTWYTIYPSLNPTGTGTLRWTSQNPNEQQISKQEIAEFSRDEIERDGKKNRSAKYMFGPTPDREWWSCDARGIEDRLPAYESKEQSLIDIFEKPNEPPYYGSNHLLRFHTVYPDIWNKEIGKVCKECCKGKIVTPETVGPHCKKKYADTYYQWVKNGGFAVQYGAIDLVNREGTADRAFHRRGSHALLKSRFNKLESLNQYWINYAKKHGYVETMPDRTVDPTRGYPLQCSRSKYGQILPTVPLNYHTQGTAMQWMNKAMVRCTNFLDQLNNGSRSLSPMIKRIEGVLKKQGYFIAIQVHDELVFSMPRGTGPEPWKTNLPIINELRRLMTAGGDDIGVPTPVSCSYHLENWQEGIDL